MADEEKPKKETPEDKPVEQKQEENIEPKVKAVEEKEQVEDKEQEKTESEPVKQETNEEKPKKDEKQEQKEPGKKEEPPKTEIKDKSKPKEEKKDKKDKAEKKAKDHDPDFKYIVRISNTDIDGEKTLIQGITSIKGIGNHMATLVVDKIKMDRSKKMGNLSDKEVEKIQETVDNIINIAPDWMLNHRKDSETGDNIHLIGPEIELRHRDEINIMKKIRCYRGIRHERGLPARGQRTRANNRTGLTLGVSKKREGK